MSTAMNKPPDIAWSTIRPAAPSAPQAPAEVLGKALAGSRELSDLLAGAARDDEPILLIVNDSHRATLTRPALLALGKLVASRPPGSPAPRFRALVATGTHRFTDAEKRAFEAATLAESGLSIESVWWHDATDTGALVDFAGARYHGALADRRRIFAIGSVEPHYFAGVTGAHKTATIGCLSYADVERNHVGALDPASDVLHLDGNPVFDGIAAFVAGLHNAGREIVTLDEVVCGGQLLAAEAGHPIETARRLLDLVARTYAHDIERPVDLLHLRVPLPLGRSLYQADKALKNNHTAVRDGGGIVLEAVCPEGVGPDAFLGLLRTAPSYADAVAQVSQRGYRLGDHKAVKLRHLTDPRCRGVRVALVTDHVSAADVATAGLRLFGDTGAAVAWLRSSLTVPCRAGLIVEDAGHVCVRTAQLSAAI